MPFKNEFRQITLRIPLSDYTRLAARVGPNNVPSHILALVVAANEGVPPDCIPCQHRLLVEHIVKQIRDGGGK